ncbi:transcriptional regulator [Streptomyces sp. NPDC087440]|uniref:transcriptional regulator n=1 Tax=Streptomyces sp. NPDC087440 TaxID=3365790 RepID=UPI0037FC68E3
MTDSPQERQPREALVNVIHSPTRLAILATLNRIQHVAFADLRDSLHLTTPELSRQLAILEKEELVEVAKLRVKRVTVTHVRLSDSGRERFAAYLDSLYAIVGEGDRGERADGREPDNETGTAPVDTAHTQGAPANGASGA